MDIAIIGLGKIGRHLANTLIKYKKIDNLILNTRSYYESIGFLNQLNEIKSFYNPKLNIELLKSATQINDPDWIIISASDKFGNYRRFNNFLTNNDRLNEYNANINIIRSIIAKIRDNIKNSNILIITNPVDLITHYVKSQIPEKDNIYGFGNTLDTIRMKTILSQKYMFTDIFGEYFVMGEHGRGLVPILSQARYETSLLSQIIDYDSLKREIASYVKKIIISSGHSTYSAIAGLDLFFDSIINKKNVIHSLSYYLNDYVGLSGITMGVPFQIEQGDIIGPTEFNYNKKEQKMLNFTAKNLYLHQRRHKVFFGESSSSFESLKIFLED